MSDYQRFVSYLYEYQNNIKTKNCGFCRVELRDHNCRLEVHLKLPLYPFTPTLKVYVFVPSNEKLYGIFLGNASYQQGNVSGTFSFSEQNIKDSSYHFSQLGGIFIQTDSGFCFASAWKDLNIHPERFILHGHKSAQQKSSAKEFRPELSFPNSNSEISPIQPENEPDQSNAEAASSISVEAEILPHTATPRTSDTGYTTFTEGKNITQESEISIESEISDENEHTNSSKFIPKIDNSNQQEDVPETNNSSQTANISEINNSDQQEDVPEANNSKQTADVSEIGNSSQTTDASETNNPYQTTNVSEIGSSSQTEKVPKHSNLTVLHTKRLHAAFENSKITSSDSDKKINSVPEPEPALLAASMDSASAAKESIPDNFWEAILKSYPQCHPFFDDEIHNCVQLSPKDVQKISASGYPINNNAFFRHNCQSFQHFLIGKKDCNIYNNYADKNSPHSFNNSENCKTHYILAVPGIYNPKEQYMASMFGFPYFKCSQNSHYRNNCWGYWYRIIPEHWSNCKF